MAETTLLEFLAPVRQSSRRNVCLAAMRFNVLNGTPTTTASELKIQLISARFPNAKKFNVADVLSSAGELVSASKSGRSFNWSLTTSGVSYTTKLLGLELSQPEIVNSVNTLSDLLSKIADPDVKDYIRESLICFEVDARRAAVVFLWTGAIRHIQEKAVNGGLTLLNAAIAKHDQKTKPIKTINDFSAVKDVTQLLAFRELGLLDKGEWQTMQEGLDLRNRCGHPTKYHPGIAKVSAFIEDVVGIAF